MRPRKKPKALLPWAESTNGGGGGDNRLESRLKQAAGSDENQCSRYFAALQYIGVEFPRPLARI
jgi:hypothetical protein